DADGRPLIDVQRARILRREIQPAQIRACPRCIRPNAAPVDYTDCRLSGADDSVCCWSCHGVYPHSAWCSGIEMPLKDLYIGAQGDELFRVCCGVVNSGAL